MQASMQSELATDEGSELIVYDDKTGLPITKGSVVEGNPTIGIGRALNVHGISTAERDMMFENDITVCEAQLAQYAWWVTLDPVRRDVLTNLTFNMGIAGVLTFQHMIAAIKAADFATAAQQLKNSKWATQVEPSRSGRLIAQLLTGQIAP